MSTPSALRLPVRRAAVCLAAALLLALLCACAAPPDDPAGRELAAAFIRAVYAERDPDLAMSLVVPTRVYGNVTRALIERVIADEAAAGCRTDPGSIETGLPGGDVRVATLSDEDAVLGIEARAVWRVASAYTCEDSATSGRRETLVTVEKVNGVWGAARITWQQLHRGE